MIKLKQLKIKNFLSIGNNEQIIDLSLSPITLIIGENKDISSENGSRNGAGKSTILQALCFALYGESLTNIRKNNLVNKTNKKNLLVVLEFEKNGIEYKIERGRNPTFLNFHIKGKKAEMLDEAEGDSRQTQKTIEKIFGMSKELFKQIIALNTFSQPFLSMPLAMQRTIIEELLGISMLSEKADILKEKIKETNMFIREEEIKIEMMKKTNSKIIKTIKDLQKRKEQWEKDRERKIDLLTEKIQKYGELDIEKEIKNHEIKSEYEQTIKDISFYERNFLTKKRRKENQEKELLSYKNKIVEIEKKKICPLCKQPMNNDEHSNKVKKELNEVIDNLKKEIFQLEKELEKEEKTISTLKKKKKEIGKIKTFYDNINEVYNHKALLDSMVKELESLLDGKNPYNEQINHLEKEGLQEIDYDRLNYLKNLLEHQKLLLKFLTNRDSFIRKKIIEQSVSFLNKRLKYYTKILKLSHIVEFEPSLEVSIKESSLDYDYDNLSRGERTRVMLALSMAFREVFENLNNSINLVFIDEVIDNGLDQLGVESSINLFETISQTKKNIFIISHREELLNRVDNVLYVTKENGFTTIN